MILLDALKVLPIKELLFYVLLQLFDVIFIKQAMDKHNLYKYLNLGLYMVLILGGIYLFYSTYFIYILFLALFSIIIFFCYFGLLIAGRMDHNTFLFIIIKQVSSLVFILFYFI
jgi:hypothetical protein